MKAFGAIAFLTCLACGAARGDVVLSLTPALQYGGHGAEIVFSGTITNTSVTDKVFLNDVSFALAGAAAANLAPDSNSFFANVPGILLPGESYASGEIFRVKLSAGAPVGDYGGTVGVLGGADISAGSALASSAFLVRETPVENWRQDHFGEEAASPAAADLADFEGDGIRNLLEYALDLDPMVPDAAALPPPLIDGGYLTFSFVPNPAATDLIYSVESSLELENWGTADVEDVTPAVPDPPGQKTFRYRHAIGPSTPRVFLRLRVTRND